MLIKSEALGLDKKVNLVLESEEKEVAAVLLLKIVVAFLLFIFLLLILMLVLLLLLFLLCTILKTVQGHDRLQSKLKLS